MTVEAPARSALDNNANNSSPPLENPGFSSRDRRYRRRSMLQPETTMPRLCKCGRTMHGDSVAVRTTRASAGFSGLTTCGSVWICPVCNAKIMARRALEIGSAVALAQRLGFSAGFLTFTMRHNKSQPLMGLWDALSYGWGATTSGKAWQKAKARFGVVGFIRVAEVTVGINGWHVHIHVLVFFDSLFPDVDGLQAFMFPRWKRALVRKGLDAPLPVAQDAQILDGPGSAALGRYLSKAQDQGSVTSRATSIGLELTSTQSKGARFRHSTRTPWMLLDEWFGDGEVESKELWTEFEQASKGRRQITWSLGLREMLGMTTEKTDEEIASEELGSSDDDLVHITKDGWRKVCATPDLIPEILNTAERSGLAGLRSLLNLYGIEYTIPEGVKNDL